MIRDILLERFASKKFALVLICGILLAFGFIGEEDFIYVVYIYLVSQGVIDTRGKNA